MVTTEYILESQTQEIIDSALDLLTFHFKVKLPAVAHQLKDFEIETTNLKLSRVRSVHRKDGTHEYKGSEGMNDAGEREELASALRKMLSKNHHAPFINGVFVVPGRNNQSTVAWGKIQIDKQKRQVASINKKTDNADTTGKTETAFNSKIISGIEQLHLVGIAPISHAQLYEYMVTAEEVKIVHTFLSDPELFVRSVMRAIEANSKIKIEILLMKPNSEAIRLRAKALSERREQNVEGSAFSNYRLIKNLEKSYPLNVEYRTYNESSGSFFLIDKMMYIGFQWHGFFANDGPYLQTYDVPGNKLAERIKEHFKLLWESTAVPNFDIEYKMHVLRAGKIKTPELFVNSSNFEAFLTHTTSKSIYHGSVIRAQGECCNIFLQTEPNEMEEDWQSRVAFLLINATRSSLATQELAVGLYIVELNNQKLFNLILLENKAVPGDISKPDKERLVTSYLSMNAISGNKSEVRLDTGILSWSDLESRVGHSK